MDDKAVFECDHAGPRSRLKGGTMRSDAFVAPVTATGRRLATVLALALLAATAAALFASCGDDDAPAEASPTRQATLESSGATAAPTAGRPAESAGGALTRQLRLLSDGDHGALWDELHPAQQALIPREQYVRCLSRIPGYELTDIRIVRTREEEGPIPGTSERATISVVTAEFTQNGTKYTETFYEVNVGGAWRWALADVSGWANGSCP